MARPDSTIIESEWVETGPDFALSHPLAQRLGAVWLVLAWVVAQAVLSAVALGQIWFGAAITLSAVLVSLMLMLIILNALAACLFLIGRHPLARPSVWIALAFSFPLSIPLMFYWAEGVRPNLIYAHRFQRLCRPDAET